MRSTSSARRQFLLAAGALTLNPCRAWAQPDSLSLGVVPNLSPRIVAAQYQPLRGWLSDALGRPVQVLTAADFATFHTRATSGHYDLFVTVPNLGALALEDGHAQLLGVGEPGISALAVAPSGQQDDALSRLPGRQVALANPASLVALRGLAWLREQGLVAGRDFGIAWSPNEDSLAQAMDSGAAPLALMSRSELALLSPARQRSIGVVQEFARLPGYFVMSPLRTPAAVADRLRGLLRDFLASPPGAVFRGMRSLRALDDADRALLAPYLPLTRHALAGLR